MAKKEKINLDATANLTDKQRRFCEEYVIDWNATRAAKDAGYSENTAYSIGQENLKKPEIESYINELRTKVAELAGVSALRNAKELAKIAYSSAATFRKDWSDVKDWDDLTEDEKAVLSEITVIKRIIGTDENSVVTEEKLHYKTHDKQKAIEMLNKMFGWNEPDKIQHSGKVEYSELSDEEIQERLANLQSGK